MWFWTCWYRCCAGPVRRGGKWSSCSGRSPNWNGRGDSRGAGSGLCGGRCRSGRLRGCRRLVLLVLRAQAVGGHLLQAAFLAAGLVARLGQLPVPPLVVVEEAVALRLVRALAAFDPALEAFLALGREGLRLAAFCGLLGHCSGSSGAEGSGFLAHSAHR